MIMLQRLLSFVGLFSVVLSNTGGYPNCRKSSDVHAIPGENVVYMFGGKGMEWDWTRKGNWKNHGVVMSPADMYSFNLDSNEWAKLSVTGKPAQRWKFTSSEIGQGELAMFGGCQTADVSGNMNDLWVFTPSGASGGTWREIQTENTPVQRRGHVAIATKTQLVVYGGKDLQDTALSDTWTISIADIRSGRQGISWTKGADFPGPMRWGGTGTLLVDAGTEYMAVFGGRNKLNKKFLPEGPKLVYYNDLWLYNVEKDTWRQVTTSQPQPTPRDHHGAARMGGSLYIYGGRASHGGSGADGLGDLWSFSIATSKWTEHLPNTGLMPHARYMPGVISVPVYGGEQGLEQLVVIGGELLPGSGKISTLNDVWTYTPIAGSAKGTWSNPSTNHCRPTDANPNAQNVMLYALFGFAIMACVGMCLMIGRSKSTRARESAYHLLLA